MDKNNKILVDETENKRIEKKRKKKQVGPSELCKFRLIFQTYNPVICILGLN
jgi:hypothetical protein